jgi:hypothetical protein
MAVSKVLAGMLLSDVASGKVSDQKTPFPLQMTR